MTERKPSLGKLPERTELVLDDAGQARLAMTLRRAKYVINHPRSEQKANALAEIDAYLDLLWGAPPDDAP